MGKLYFILATPFFGGDTQTFRGFTSLDAAQRYVAQNFDPLNVYSIVSMDCAPEPTQPAPTPEG